MSKQIEIWRDIMDHYHNDPARQNELFQELISELRKQILPPIGPDSTPSGP